MATITDTLYNKAVREASTLRNVIDKQQAEIDEWKTRLDKANEIHADMFRDTGGVLARTELCKTIDRQQAEIDELEQFCINIYMSLSVSELHKVTAPVEEAWNKGQKLWLRNTKHKGE